MASLWRLQNHVTIKIIVSQRPTRSISFGHGAVEVAATINGCIFFLSSNRCILAQKRGMAPVGVSPLASACSALFPFGAVLRVTQSVRLSVGPSLCTRQRVCSCQSDRLQRCSVRGATPLLDIRTESRQKFRRDGARLALSSVA